MIKLKELREKIGLKQYELAKMINKTKSAYGYYESGKNEPDIKTLIQLADIFHISVDELIGRENNNTIDKGLLNNTQLNIIDILQELNEINQNRLESYAVALYQTQQDQQEITNKFKGA